MLNVFKEQIEKIKDRIDWKRMEDSLMSLAKPVLEILGKGKETSRRH